MDYGGLVATHNNQSGCEIYGPGSTLLGKVDGEEVYKCMKSDDECIVCAHYEPKVCEEFQKEFERGRPTHNLD